MRLSVVLPHRDRAGPRLESCLRSLRWQTLPSDEVEIVVSDLGSRPEVVAELGPLAARYGARLLTQTDADLWNRSRALNLGLAAATGEIALASDVDMIFRPDFLAVVLAEADAGFVLCRALDLPPLPPRRWQAADYPWLESRASLRRAMGTGACQAAPRAFFLTHPYDEGYRHWGFEDKDMVVRARRAGLALRFIHHRTSMLHQHHPRTKGEHPWLERRNKLRFWTRRWGLR